MWVREPSGEAGGAGRRRARLYQSPRGSTRGLEGLSGSTRALEGLPESPRRSTRATLSLHFVRWDLKTLSSLSLTLLSIASLSFSLTVAFFCPLLSPARSALLSNPAAVWSPFVSFVWHASFSPSPFSLPLACGSLAHLKRRLADKHGRRCLPRGAPQRRQPPQPLRHCCARATRLRALSFSSS